MKKAYLFAFLVIAIALGFTLWGFSGAMTSYVTLKQARLSDSPVQVRGIILRDPAHPIYYDTRLNAFRFWIKDANDEQIEVIYHGAKPDAFDTAPGTAARGIVRNDPATGKAVFVSDSLVVQCPSKYGDAKSPYGKAGLAGGSS